jgi:hypothetical protein
VFLQLGTWGSNFSETSTTTSVDIESVPSEHNASESESESDATAEHIRMSCSSAGQIALGCAPQLQHFPT